MERRRFIKISAAALAGIAAPYVPSAEKQQRLFGEPASLNIIPVKEIKTHVTLPLSKAQLPLDGIETAARYAALWDKLLTDKEFKREFFRNPQDSFARFGIQELAERNNYEMSALFALNDPNVVMSLQHKDYKDFFHKLSSHHAFTSSAVVPEGRIDKINEAIMKNAMQLKESYDKRRSVETRPISSVIDDEELSFIAMSTCGSPGVVAAAAVIVVVAVAAATYVAVGVNVAAALNVAAAVSVVTYAAVATSGPAAMLTQQVYLESTQQPIYNTIIESSLPDLSKINYHELISAAQIAAISGDQTLASHSIREVVRREIDVSIKAAEELELIHIHPDQRRDVIEAATTYTLKVMSIKQS